MKKEQFFCESQWKIGAAFLTIIAVSLFFWGVHILTEHHEYNISYVPETSTPDSAKAVSVKAEVAQKPVFPADFEKTIVSIGIDSGQDTPLAILGSGVLVSDDGHIVTADHLVAGLSGLHVLQNNVRYESHLIKRVAKSNIALLKIESLKAFPFTSIDCSMIEIGTPVYAFGRDQGIIAKEGIARNTGVSLAINDMIYPDLITTDAIYTWAQSGGPLMNVFGNMVGLNIAISGPQNSIQGFAVPAPTICSKFREIVHVDSITNIKVYAGGLTSQFWKNTRETASEYATQIRNTIESSSSSDLMVYIEGNKGDLWKQARFVADRMAEIYNKADGINYLNNAVSDPELNFFGYHISGVIGLLLLGFVSGISAGMVTMGGGIIKVSGLMIIFGYGLIIIRPVAYITNIFVYSAAALRYKKDNLISWHNVKPLIPFALFGFVFGYFTGIYLNNSTIRMMLGIYALLIGIKVVTEIIRSAMGYPEFEGISQNQTGHRFKNSWLGLPMGVMSGILGISGGVIEVPLQRYVAKVPLKEAIANSSVLVFWTSSLGAVISMVHGAGIGAFEIDTPLILALIVIPGAYFGGMVGAWLTKIMPINLLKSIYCVLMFLIAARMMLFTF
ncbi:MAG: TSUP family transporter [SAR324 cluster bacterium]|nr:TSUP family transporter [SAR324 cluster bacterium]